MLVEVLIAAAADLGEGPVWDADGERLLWVNITEGEVHATTLDGVDNIVHSGTEPVGFVTPHRDGWVIGSHQRLLFTPELPTDDEPAVLFALPELAESLRLNDGKTSPDGRLVFGTKCDADTPAAGAFYSLDPKTLELSTIATDVTISNGLAWTADGATLFYIDTPTRTVDMFDWENGHASNRRPLTTFPEHFGFPDGMTIDDHGLLWVAFWGGSAVRGVDRSGTVVHTVELAARNPTSVAVGPDDVLFVTSARTDSPQRAADGAIFVIRR